MPYYRPNFVCECRKGCQSYRRPGVTFQWRVSGSIGYLAYIANWQSCPFVQAIPGQCVWFNDAEQTSGDPPIVWDQEQTFISLSAADQSDRAQTFAFQIGIGPPPPPGSASLNTPNWRETECERLPNFATADCVLTAAGVINVSDFGPLLEMRWGTQ